MTPRLVLCLMLVAPVTTAVPAQSTVPVRPLGKAIAASSVTFGSIAQVRQLSDGRVLVNDAARRQIVLLDAALSHPQIVIDSVGGRENSYGSCSASLIAYIGDSTFFVDAATQSLLVIDPGGKIARVIAIPPIPRNAPANLASRGFGTPAFHPARGLVFGARCPCPPMRLLPPGSPEVSFIKPDSSSVVAVNLVTRTVDTLVSPIVGWTAVKLSSTAVNQSTASIIYPRFDEWAMTPDGAIAFLDQAFHLRWLALDGARTEPVRLPFDWHRIPENEKTRLADSINTIRQQRFRVALEQFIKDSVARLILPDDGPRPDYPATVTPSDFPDFMPAFARNALRADADGNVWIRTNLIPPMAGGIVYDIANRKSEIFDRVQAPDGRTVVDFGAGGIVYLVARDAGLSLLERARFK